MEPSKPRSFEHRYRLYLDESGDHVFRDLSMPHHRYLCLLGCWFKNPEYLTFHEALEDLKKHFFVHHPDDPVILHREDIINRRREFKALQDGRVRAEFDDALFEILEKSAFTVVAVVIDKKRLRELYGETAAHPYHLGLGFLLQRYAGFLNHVNRVGDVMAESRGGTEDRLLKQSYTRVFEHGAWTVRADSFQAALTSRELKIKLKSANVSGLQLADLLGHPVKQHILRLHGCLDEPQTDFAERLIRVADVKFNRHLYDGRVEGYGYVFYPQ